jgi:hypothetical protein
MRTSVCLVRAHHLNLTYAPSLPPARVAWHASLALFDASDFTRRGGVRIQSLENHALEAVLVAIHLDALLRLTRRPPLDSWRAAGSPGVDFGQALFASGDLHRLAERHSSTVPVLEELLARYHCVTGAPASGKSTLGRQLARGQPSSNATRIESSLVSATPATPNQRNSTTS